MTAVVRERQILFEGPMVRRVIDGSKTQTRRLVKPAPPSVEAVRAKCGDGFSIFTDRHASRADAFRVAGPVWISPSMAASAACAASCSTSAGSPARSAAQAWAHEHHEALVFIASRVGLCHAPGHDAGAEHRCVPCAARELDQRKAELWDRWRASREPRRAAEARVARALGNEELARIYEAD